MASKSSIEPLIVIVGETASGKSSLVNRLAKTYNGEIICGDSRTVYRGMDIGTAKPTTHDRLDVPHHMLDIVDPDERFSVAIFQRLTEQIIRDIVSRGRIPILVGGSGLYIDAVLFNYTLRSRVSERSDLDKYSTEELYALASNRRLEPVSKTNRRYLIRLLQTGEAPPNNRDKIRDNCLVIGLKTDRSTLRYNIENRVEAMFRDGLKREVSDLLQRYTWEDYGMTGVGYKEFQAYYQGDASMGQVKRKIIANTLQLAKRQRTWFKRNQSIRWLSDYSYASELVKTFIEEVVSRDDGRI